MRMFINTVSEMSECLLLIGVAFNGVNLFKEIIDVLKEGEKESL